MNRLGGRPQGVREPTVIWQALPQRLAGREFLPPPGRMATRLGSLTECGGRPYRSRSGRICGASSPASFSASLDYSGRQLRIPRSALSKHVRLITCSFLHHFRNVQKQVFKTAIQVAAQCDICILGITVGFFFDFYHHH